MCGISLSDGSAVGRISNEEMRLKLGIGSIREVIHEGRPRLFGHIERIEREA